MLLPFGYDVYQQGAGLPEGPCISEARTFVAGGVPGVGEMGLIKTAIPVEPAGKWSKDTRKEHTGTRLTLHGFGKGRR